MTGTFYEKMSPKKRLHVTKKKGGYMSPKKGVKARFNATLSFAILDYNQGQKKFSLILI